MKTITNLSILLSLFIGTQLIAQNKTNLESIEKFEEISLGGDKQWIFYNGESVDNPVLLFLHGGPGFAQTPYSHFDSKKLKKHFIVVNWDQLGAGKSYNKEINPKTMTVNRFLNDTYELIKYLKKRFNKKKIFIVGHSWGSVLGLYTAINHPDDIYAYIGMGQAIDLLQGEKDAYNFTLDKAKEIQDSVAIKTLNDIGTPPFKGGFQSLIKQRILLGKYGGAFHNIGYKEIEKIRMSSPYYNEIDQKNYMEGYGFSQYCLWDQLMEVNFFNEKKELKAPIYFFEGRYDYGTPFALVEKYFDVLKAPCKEIVWFDNSGHFPNLEETEKYQDELIKILNKTKL